MGEGAGRPPSTEVRAGRSWLRLRPREPAAFLRFCLVGASGMAVDLSLLHLLLAAGQPYPLTRALAIAVAMTWNFAWNRRLTFPGARQAGVLPQYARYVGSSGLGALLSWSTAVALSNILPAGRLWLTLGAVIGVGVGTATNFLLSSRWVFRRWRG